MNHLYITCMQEESQDMFTVQPAYKDHTLEISKVAFTDRCFYTQVHLNVKLM